MARLWTLLDGRRISRRMAPYPQAMRSTYISRLAAATRGLQWPLVLFLIIVFFLTSQDLFFSQRYAEEFSLDPMASTKTITEGQPSRQIALLALGLFGVLSLFRKRGEPSAVKGWLGVLVGFYLSWSFLSILWTQDLQLTSKRLIVLLMLCLGAVAAARHLRSQNLSKFTFCAAGFYLVLGILAEVVLHTFHPSLGGYRFCGTVHPNRQAMNCALLLLASVCGSSISIRGRRWFQLCAVVALVFLVLTGSRTALWSATLCVFVYWSLVWSRWRKLAAVFCVVSASALFLLLFCDSSMPALTGIALLGRDASAETLTGRYPLWQECMNYVGKHPILGHGYGAFWTVRHIVEISFTSPWSPSEAHSTYIDSLLDLGILGGLTLISVFVLGIKRSISHYRETHDPNFAFAAVLLLFCALDGALESIISQPELITFLCMVVVARLCFRWIPEKEVGCESRYHYRRLYLQSGRGARARAGELSPARNA